MFQIKDICDVTVKVSNKDIFTMPYSIEGLSKDDIICTIKERNFLEGKITFETKDGDKFEKIPVKLYKDGSIVGKIEGYTLEGTYDANLIEWH